MKRDLAEFTQVVQHDTACTIAATASVVKDKLAVSRGVGELGAAERGEWDTPAAGTLVLPLRARSLKQTPR